MKIITLTLNPAYDVHCHAENFQPFHENLARITSSEVGGKGINISRALTVNGVENTAVVIVGDENGREFLSGLEKDGIHYKSLTVPGRIRENFTLHSDGQPETRISFAGFSVDDSVMDEVEKFLQDEDLTDAVVTFTGRLPNGLSLIRAKQFLRAMQAAGAKIVLDSKSFAKEDVLQVRPWLIKPNEEEIALYTDLPVTDRESAAEAAKKLQAQGVENVMISLGAQGAVLCCGEGVFFAPAPAVDAISTIGAGDSTIAGFVAAVSQGNSCANALQQAVAYGSASCLTPGTEPPCPKDIRKLLTQ